MTTNLRRAGMAFGLLLALAMFSIGVVLAKEGVSIDQCANGASGTPRIPCNDPQYQNGNLNASNSQYTEGNVVPFRLILTGLVPSTVYSVTIRWEYLNSGKHAYDYITTYNTTEPGDPCTGVAGANCVGPSTFPIPTDPTLVAACNTALHTPVTPIPGVFTLFGGAITNVGPYSMLTCGSGNQDQSIVVTFTAGQATEVLAWGGHVGRQADWGVGNGATQISGSPYHMFLDSCSFGCGNKDRSMKAEAPTTATAVSVSSMSAHVLDDGAAWAMLGLGALGIVTLGGVLFVVARKR